MDFNCRRIIWCTG